MMSLQRILLLALAGFWSVSVYSQTQMNIYKSDGTVIQIPISEVDSVTHSLGELVFPAQLVTGSIDCLGMESFVASGEVIDDGGAEVTEMGFCWSTAPDPTIDDDVLTVVVQEGAFTGEISGLNSETLYYVRAFAVNAAGVGYSENMEVATLGVTDDFLNPDLNYDSVVDIDGNVYPTIVIGEQEWMAENLRVTHYNNGDPILVIVDDEGWESIDEGAYSIYENDCNVVVPYGKKYNWHAVIDDRNVCPTGWHVPTNDEWEILTLLFGGLPAGGALKAAGTEYWLPPNVGATNASGLSLLPGGERADDGFFNAIGVLAAYWTATENGPNHAFYRELSYGHSNVYTAFDSRQSGFSVRCVKD